MSCNAIPYENNETLYANILIRKGQFRTFLLSELLTIPLSQRCSFQFSFTCVTLPHMAVNRFRCIQCDKEEERCDCDKYCGFCEGFQDVRLCGDGIYYCGPCRNASNYKAEDEK